MSTKQKLLDILQQANGRAISGEGLAKQLYVTRAAVWKAIKQLQSQGHEIEAVSGKGYTLKKLSDELTAQGVLMYLSDKDVTVIAEKCVDSTNTLAKELAAQGAPHASVVLAECQTAGRGRLGRNFSSPLGTGLYMSIILKGDAVKNSGMLVTCAAAVAVCKSLELVANKGDIGIKWVNDLYIHEKKCCGILCEATADVQTNTIDSIIVGIGLNLYEPKDGFDDVIKDIATAIFKREERVEKCKLAADIVNRLTQMLSANDSGAFMGDYIKRNIVPGKDVLVLQASASYSARATRINLDGSLEVKLPSGEVKSLSFGEVSLKLQ